MSDAQPRVDCDTCGKATPHTQRGVATNSEEVDIGDDFPPMSIQWTHIFAQCDVCEDISLSVYSDYDPEDLLLLYPPRKNLDGVPIDIQTSYLEAKKVKGASPTAFAVMIRRTLEFICLDKKAVGKDLKKMLDDLSEKGIIPDTLAKMSHVLRDFGNVGAHAGSTKVSAHEARVMEDFLLAVIEYVYIAPARLAKLAEQKASVKKPQ